jgi:predicted nucleotidyltransferase
LLAQFFQPKLPLPSHVRSRVIDDMRRRIEAAAPVRAIVFGSFADGTENTDSDLDILVVCADENHIKHCRTMIYADLHGPLTAIPVDLIFVTVARFEEMSEKGGICMIAKNCGFDLLRC